MIKLSAPKCLQAFMLLTLLVWGGCSKDNSPTNPPHDLRISLQTAPPNLVLGDSTYYQIQVATSFNGVQMSVDSVRAVVLNDTGPVTQYISLLDDGGAYELTDNLTFASVHSGDNVPNDGSYSRLINSRFTQQQGSFQIAIFAWYEGNFWGTQSNFSVNADTPPIISNLFMPDSLLSGFTPVQINIQAIDPDTASGDYIAAVEMRLINPSGDPTDSIYSMQHTAGSTYILPLTAAFALGHPTGEYLFRFYAYDTYNLHSDTLSRSVYMENLAPYLADPVLPDTIVQPVPGDTTYFPIMVRCWDDQGVEDLVSVALQALKPDQTWGPVVDMFDNGNLQVYGDSLAGDSVYTRVVSIWPSNLLGLYQFHFRSTDQAGNQNEIIDSLWVVTP